MADNMPMGGGVPAGGGVLAGGAVPAGGDQPLRVDVRRGDATDEEVAAVVAAIEACWPRPASGGAPAGNDGPRWRFSGRWWTKPVPLRRDRPTPYLRSS